MGGSPPPPPPAVQTQVQQATIPAELKPFITDILEESQAVKERRMEEGYVPFEGPRIAEFTPEQQQAFSGVKGLVGAGEQYFDPAARLTAASAIAPTRTEEVQQYMSPYIQNVIDIQTREAQRQADVAEQQLAAQSVGAGGFGGSREAILQAEQQRNLQQQLGDIQARGLAAAYEDAQRRMAEQRQRELGAGAQFSALGVAAPGQTMRELQGLEAVGAQQQAQQQQALNIAQQEYEIARTFPERTLQDYSSIIRGFAAPIPASTTSTTQTTTPAPSFLQQATGAGLAAAGLSKAFSGFNKGGLISLANGGPPMDRLNPQERRRAMQDQYALENEYLPEPVGWERILNNIKGIINRGKGTGIALPQDSSLQANANRRIAPYGSSKRVALTNQLRAEEESRNASEGNTPFDLTRALRSLGQTEYESEQERQAKEAERRNLMAKNLLASDFPVRLPDTQESSSSLPPINYNDGRPSVSVRLPPPLVNDKQESSSSLPSRNYNDGRQSVSVPLPQPPVNDPRSNEDPTFIPEIAAPLMNDPLSNEDPTLVGDEGVGSSAGRSESSAPSESINNKVAVVENLNPSAVPMAQDIRNTTVDLYKQLEKATATERKELEKQTGGLSSDRWMEVANLGFSILSQPGGQTFLEAIGKGATQSGLIKNLGKLNDKQRALSTQLASLDRRDLQDKIGLTAAEADRVYKDKTLKIKEDEIEASLKAAEIAAKSKGETAKANRYADATKLATSEDGQKLGRKMLQDITKKHLNEDSGLTGLLGKFGMGEAGDLYNNRTLQNIFANVYFQNTMVQGLSPDIAASNAYKQTYKTYIETFKK